MADYKAIRGYAIQTVDGDPSNIALGQVWYNSSAKKVKVGKTQAAAWSSATALPAATNNQAGFGTTTAAVLRGGGSGWGGGRAESESRNRQWKTERDEVHHGAFRVLKHTGVRL